MLRACLEIENQLTSSLNYFCRQGMIFSSGLFFSILEMMTYIEFLKTENEGHERCTHPFPTKVVVPPRCSEFQCEYALVKLQQ
jgi:hypothetical protein